LLSLKSVVSVGIVRLVLVSDKYWELCLQRVQGVEEVMLKYSI
jgi:hypothetical protein